MCDIDVLRTFVSGWEQDYAGAGSRIRPVALAIITAYLRGGGDVVLPQLLAREEELDRFVRAGTDADAEVVEVLLTADPEACVRRFEARGDVLPSDRAARAAVSAAGGASVLREYYAALVDLAARRPWTRLVEAREGNVDETCAAVAAVT